MASSSRHGHARSRDPSLSPSPPPPRQRDRDREELPSRPRRRDDRRDDRRDELRGSPSHHLDDGGAAGSGSHRRRDDDLDSAPVSRRTTRDSPPIAMPPPEEEPIVNETVAMISNMKPYLHRDTYVFTELPYESGAALPALLPHLHTLTTEREAMSILVPRSIAKEHGLPTNLSPRLSHIELTVRSGLDGVGLTAAVSAALSAGEIACNIVAGVRHDHLFVPEDRAEMAMDVLKALAKQTRKIEREQRRGSRREERPDMGPISPDSPPPVGKPAP